MKKIVPIAITLIIEVCLCFMFTSCSNQKIVRPDTPVNAGIVMESFLKAGNYEDFNELFTDGRKNSVSIKQFNELRKLTTAGTGYELYELHTFSNGKMILIRLTPDKINGEYKIEDVKEVPKEIKSLLQ